MFALAKDLPVYLHLSPLPFTPANGWRWHQFYLSLLFDPRWKESVQITRLTF